MNLRKQPSLSRGFLLLLVIFSLTACGSPQEKRDKFFRKGLQLLEKGEVSRAAVEFRNALQADPKFAPAYYQLGVCYWRQKKFQQAYAAFRKALELDSSLTEGHLYLARIYLLAGKPEKTLEELQKYPREGPETLVLKATALYLTGKTGEAKKLLRDSLAQDPQNTRAAFLLAQFYLQEKAFSRAEHLLKDIRQREPQNLRALLLLAETAHRQGRLSEAREVLQGALKEGLRRPEIYLFLTRIYREEGKPGEAQRVLAEGLAQFPQNWPLRKTLAEEYFASGKRGKARALLKEILEKDSEGPLAPKARLQLAYFLFQEKKITAALKELENLTQEHPSFYPARILKGDLLLLKGDLHGAIAEYRQALEGEPRNLLLKLKLARAHLLNREWSLAEDLYGEVLRASPQNPEALWGLARVYAFTQRESKALDILRKLLQQNPDFWPALRLGVDLHLQARQPEKALAWLEEIYKDRSRDPLYYVLRGRILLARGDLGRARKALEKSLELDPENLEALSLLGEMARGSGGPEKTLKAYKELLQKHPHSLALRLLLAQLYEETGRPLEARKLYEEVLARKPGSFVAANNLAFNLAQYEPTPETLRRARELIEPWLQKLPQEPHVVDTAAWVLYRSGDYQKALDLLLSLAPEERKDAVFSYHLGMIYYRLGKKKEARNYLRQALEGPGKFPGREEARSILRQLEGELDASR